MVFWRSYDACVHVRIGRLDLVLHRRGVPQERRMSLHIHTPEVTGLPLYRTADGTYVQAKPGENWVLQQEAIWRRGT